MEPQKAQKKKTKGTKFFAFVPSTSFVPFVVQFLSCSEP